MRHETKAQFATTKPPFGTWLLQQMKRDDDIGRLAKAAFADPRFPREGDFNAVSKRLNEQQADGEIHAVLEDAELDWAAL